MTLGKSDTAENVGQHIQFAGQCAVHHDFLGFIEQGVKIASVAKESAINTVHPRNGFGIDKQPIHQVRKVITGGAVNWPVFREPLPIGKNFFNDDIDWLRIAFFVQ